MNEPRRKPKLLTIIGPGVLVAATGVGAGDLSMGALTGSQLGLVILWAAVVGAFLKYLLSEGLTRWQLATGDTLLEGAADHLGPIVRYGFLAYVVLWSFGVGAALMSACGVTAHAVFPLGSELNPDRDKIIYGVAHSLIAVVMVRIGGYRLFEKVMSVCIAIMFCTVVATAIAIGPEWGEVLAGICWPRIPNLDGDGLQWTVGLMGGVGGTVTILCYGYWIREEGRSGIDDLKICRLDLAIGYGMTALFGIGMVIIGTQISAEGRGSRFVVDLAGALETKLGVGGLVAKWAFLVGAWGAVFSSLLGVWQSIPYLFADFWGLTFGRTEEERKAAVETNSPAYRGYLYAIATVPMLGLFRDFTLVQKWNAIIGAFIIPMLAAVLLILNGREKWVGRDQRNSPLTTFLLTTTLLFFLLALWFEVQKKFGS
jgi:Mn2+/Fe2+ NRAMP family transporter